MLLLDTTANQATQEWGAFQGPGFLGTTMEAL